MARKRSDLPAYQTSKSSKPKRCLCYARCSLKKGDTDQSDSITAQTDSLTRIVQRFGLEWDGQVFSDDGVSGWKTRDGLELLLDAVSRQQGANVLVIRSLSRLTRLPPMDGAKLLERLRDSGITSVYTEDAGELILPEPDDSWGWAKLVMDSGMTHGQSRATSFNVASAMVSQLMRSVADASKQPPWSESKQPRRLKVTSAPPYGYRDIKTGQKPAVLFERHLDPETAPIVQRVFKLFLAGKTSCAIARLLNQEGLRTRKGKLFSNDTIEECLGNPAYLGTFARLRKGCASFHHCLKSGVVKVPDAARRGRRNQVPAQVVNDPDEQLILPDCWEPLLSQRDFDRIQAKIAQRAKKGTKARKESGALSCGVARCGHCGAKLRLARYARGATYFCVTPESGVGGCDYGGHVREDYLLPQLMREITKALGKETQRLETCLATPTAAPQPTDAIDRRITQVSSELDASNATLCRLMKLTPAPETAIDMAVAAIEKQSAELATLRTQRQAMVKLPADQASDIRERLEWLQRHAVAVREWRVNDNVEYQADHPGSPYIGFTELGSDGKDTRYQSTRLHYDAERLRGLCQELGLTVSVTWEGRRGDSHRGYVRNATATFSVNGYQVASASRRARHSVNISAGTLSGTFAVAASPCIY